MESLRILCDHAILIEDGVIELDGDPTDVAKRYLQLNFADHRPGPTPVRMAPAVRMARAG